MKVKEGETIQELKARMKQSRGVKQLRFRCPKSGWFVSEMACSKCSDPPEPSYDTCRIFDEPDPRPIPKRIVFPKRLSRRAKRKLKNMPHPAE